MPNMPESIKTAPKTPSPQPLQQFTLFPYLPTELRLKIWSFCYTLQLSRIVTILTQPNHKCKTHTRKGNPYCPRYDPTPQPTLVNTCRESRAIARSEAFKANHLIFTNSSSPNSGVFFRPEKDILYLPSPPSPAPTQRLRAPNGAWAQLKHQHPEICHHSLRFLALDLERYGKQFNPLRLALFDFPALEELTFVVPPGGLSLLSRGRGGCPGWLLGYELDEEKLAAVLEENLMLFKGVWARRTLGERGFGEGIAVEAPRLFEAARGEVEVEVEVEVQGQVKRLWPRVRLGVVILEGRSMDALGEKR